MVTDNELLCKLSRDIGDSLTIYAFSSQNRRGNDSIRFQYTWSGTDGVRYLVVQLVPQGRSAGLKQEKVLEPYTSNRNEVWKVSMDGLFQLRIFAHLRDGRRLETDLGQSMRICLGRIQPPRYTIEPAGGGWQKLEIRGADLELYEESLFVRYDRCTYRLPRKNGKLVQVCYIPSMGEIQLIVEDPLLPKPENRE